MHEAGHPKLVLWGNPEGRGGEGAASRVQGQGIHVYLRLIRDEGGQKTPQCCQVIVLQLNKFLRYLYMIWGVKQSDVVSGSAYMHIFILSQLEVRPSSIAPNPDESREAPPNSTVSLNSQRHLENLPEVTGTSQGNPGFPAATRERP